MRREDPAREAVPVSRDENGRCRLHGGLSTGPKTAEGIERIRRAVTKHGNYSGRAKAERAEYRELVRACREILAGLSCNGSVT